MLKELYIVLTDHNGDTVIGIKENIGPVSLKKPSKSLQKLLNDTFLIKRLIDQGNEYLSLQEEMYENKLRQDS